ncbi:type ii restriction-modification system modification subunit [Lactobacillus pasteurii DSM 23907 = CRBIP 24.76]|uniref:Type II restriction-modification system modification subunit n=1 Tax=Lactobacillus pasteurii DSM 23907 = CRBIP 24.76 TaxID=1423790 RepID=I7J114_9LACO|nr:hypothetical protein [Lactobacillus pasteurii]KRK08901.1 type ii restriction-modification system modification subunit [Lactobacillus pasteurii DSM 23907 = CRBIP 24.76]TDG76264.1 hypothetical protein C5L33_001023 [Lactobacillus pasteurii]CCI86012.1 Type II restriction-modification system modification subunit [Lactobacillus pasteurii DSM 23907 = CRBIP 24.76]
MGEELKLFDSSQLKIPDYELQEINQDDQNLIKSKERVQQHGEVFTPNWMVKKMLAEEPIQAKIRDLHATFLEPSAGEGAFLVEILHQKLNYVDQISNKTNWMTNAIWALMSIYGIELLMDNLIKARAGMMEVVLNHYQAFFQKKLSMRTDFYKTVEFVIKTNIVQGDTLQYVNSDGQLIEFSQWHPVDGKVQREVFTYKSLFNNSDIDDVGAADGQLSLFDEPDDAGTRFALCDVVKVYKEEIR